MGFRPTSWQKRVPDLDQAIHLATMELQLFEDKLKALERVVGNKREDLQALIVRRWRWSAKG